MVKERKIDFEGIPNARDLGGLQTRSGKFLRRGYLIRSANLSGATKADEKKLREEWRLSLVLDLRTPMAAGMKPDVVISGVDYRAVPIFEDAMIGVSHENDRDYARRKTAMPDLAKLYRMMVSRPECRERFRKAILLILEHDFEKGSVLWHCSEGKDRCGLIAAMLLSVLDVDMGIIKEDYLLTNEVNNDRAEYYYHQVIQNGGSEEVAVTVRNAFLAKEEYFDAAFDFILTEYRDMENYFRAGLEIPDRTVEEFREKILLAHDESMQRTF